MTGQYVTLHVQLRRLTLDSNKRCLDPEREGERERERESEREREGRKRVRECITRCSAYID